VVWPLPHYDGLLRRQRHDRLARVNSRVVKIRRTRLEREIVV
jgi:hypothetical protein